MVPRTPIIENAPCVLAHARGLMTPAEGDFWARLRHALRDKGMELRVLAHHDPQGDPDVPVRRVRNELRSVPPAPDTGWRAWRAPAPPREMARYLARETRWSGPPATPVNEAQRHHALCFFHDFYRDALREARPTLTLIWNGQHPQEMLLADLCRAAGCPVLFMERAPIPGSIHVDEYGILAATAIARAQQWRWEGAQAQAHWSTIATEVAAAAANATWWEQPPAHDIATLRQSLGIRDGQQVLLFAGQVDRDTQNLLYSPHFDCNASALAWFCTQLPTDGSVFLLGKHHPKSTVPAAEFRAIVGERGVWTEDVSVADALELADRVAAVNSTVLFEGLLRNKPALALGASLLSGKGIAYELTNHNKTGTLVLDWLVAEDAGTRAARWHDFFAYLLAHEFYSMDPAPEGQRGVDALAARLANNATARAAVDYDVLGIPGSFAEEVALHDTWRARAVEHQGLKEVLRGMNISAKALLEPRAPAVYATLKQWADRAYGPEKK